MGAIGLKNSSNWNPMKIINWNVRGASRKGFYGQVRYLISKFNPNILAFVGTRVNSNEACKIIEKSNFPIFFKILRVGFLRGFGLHW